MIQKFPRLIQLECGFQNYEWGKIGNQSAVYNLVSQSIQNLDSSKPYAELWMGTHPNVPSYAILNGQKTKLSDLIQQNPEHFLGQKSLEQFNKTDSLPFLFKVLSINKALSIQAHPDKQLAIILHEKFPKIYEDNHKPEMCIALTNFEALCTFGDKQKILKNFQNTPELAGLFKAEEIQQFQNEEDLQKQKIILKSLFSQIYSVDKQIIKQNIQTLIDRLNNKAEKNDRDVLMLRLHQQFPYDVGILVSNMLNYFILSPGDFFIMHANDPHAYLQGNCVECMVNCDNVVRAGLTPKFQDVETLTSMLTYNMAPPPVQKGIVLKSTQDYSILAYPTSYKEFQCYQIKINNQVNQTSKIKSQYPQIMLVIEGEGNVISVQETLLLKMGTIIYITPDTEYYVESKSSLTIFIGTPEDSQIQIYD